jgi:hypothetical protein
MGTPSTLNLALRNASNSSEVYAYITGRALDNNNALFILSADGKTPYYPTSPSSTIQPLAKDCSIPLGSPGSTKTVTVPHLAGARIYFSIDAKLTFYLNPGPALVEPSVTNPSDPNINLTWGFCEFTYNSAQVYVDISYVDFVSIPISLTLQSTNTAVQHVSGIPSNGLDTICAALKAQDAQDHAGWSSLVVQNGGKNLRALSPNLGIVTNNALFRNYYTPYVNAVWSRYASTTLNVNTQAQWGTLAGRVASTAASSPLVVGGSQSFAAPTAADIFSCSTGPFANTGDVQRGAIVARLAAAFNRSTLLLSSTVPDPATVGRYYDASPTNHYSRIVHAANLDRRGYAFPYDDVAPDGGADQSGSVFSGDPVLLTVAVGGVGASTKAAVVREEKEL